MRAWLGPGLTETEHKPDILTEHGMGYLHGWVLNDVPRWLRTKHGPMIALPYSVELNDVPVYAMERGQTPAFYDRVVETLAQFEGKRVVHPRC